MFNIINKRAIKDMARDLGTNKSDIKWLINYLKNQRVFDLEICLADYYDPTRLHYDMPEMSAEIERLINAKDNEADGIVRLVRKVWVYAHWDNEDMDSNDWLIEAQESWAK